MAGGAVLIDHDGGGAVLIRLTLSWPHLVRRRVVVIGDSATLAGDPVWKVTCIRHVTCIGRDCT
jgi:hypothetical protein